MREFSIDIAAPQKCFSLMGDLTTIDLFSGAGGLSTGAFAAGMNVKIAVERDPLAALTYKENHRGVNVINSDVTLLEPSSLPITGGIGAIALIGLVGMDEDRYIRMVEAIDPSIVYTGIGNSGSSSWSWLTTNAAAIAERLSGRIRDASSFEFDCDSISQTEDALTNVFKKLSDYNICIITLNNKISTLGVSTFSLKHREVQLCSAPALVYNYSGYSIPSETFISFPADDLFSKPPAF